MTIILMTFLSELLTNVFVIFAILHIWCTVVVYLGIDAESMNSVPPLSERVMSVLEVM